MTTSVGNDKSNGFQARASGLLQPSPIPEPSSLSSNSPRPLSGVSAVSGHSTNEKLPEDQASTSRTKSHSISSNVNTLASSKGSVAAENREKQRAVRTLPPWVQTAEEDEDELDHAKLLPRTPTSIRPPSHNHMPTPKANAVPGRHFDHAREGTPVTISSPISENASKWQKFTKSSSYGRPPSSRGNIVDENWMKENMPDLEAPWQPEDHGTNADDDAGFWLLNPSRRKRRIKRVQRVVIKNPMVPLVVRLTVLTFSALALGLAGTIFFKAHMAGCSKGPSTYLALIIDIVAIIYTVYITYDEYTSKPLGLRSHRAKLRLIFLDLLFIVFDSANLSLAFEALYDDRWACRESPSAGSKYCAWNHDICVRQKALTGTLLVALVAWLMTFGISTLRLVEKVIGR
ncbi:hypothetical protein AOQ84DRAFT_52960 [Glonium stellatum]|uniref:Regulator of phospholipase D SRF1 n=1 Tax=Glonium stellatum TaxID=574774 RepID=A0A8E2FBK0_9PEZI|nr:hypothetical protein AOQ84DRAFT_52960 [Glonium stellatum]